MIPYKASIIRLLWAVPLKRGNKIADQNKNAVIEGRRSLRKMKNERFFYDRMVPKAADRSCRLPEEMSAHFEIHDSNR